MENEEGEGGRDRSLSLTNFRCGRERRETAVIAILYSEGRSCILICFRVEAEGGRLTRVGVMGGNASIFFCFRVEEGECEVDEGWCNYRKC